MRETVSLNRKWAFMIESNAVPQELPKKPYWVNLPHTWNAIDGQDGENDYYRGVCWYVRNISRDDLPQGERFFLEIGAANSSADVYFNGEHISHHDGGYSLFRVELTDYIREENLLVIGVDNSPNDHVYPQMADFTFYGGLYRSVKLIGVPQSHFDLMYCGAPGIAVTPKVYEKDADVSVEVYVENPQDGQRVRYGIFDREGNVVCEHTQPVSETKYTAHIKNVSLWQGTESPYLYTASAQLLDQNGVVIDHIHTRFGCRSFAIDPRKGFLLNGAEYPLRGVARHQDWLGIGNALLPEHHEKDIDLICEMGANTVRLAHYQHDPYFYDLCDERGLVVWAEIPYISKHMPLGRENTLSQMRELIVQNYNHASIALWGLSNEITMNGDKDEDLLANHRLLNDMVHQMDPTRLTTLAALSMCPTDSLYLKISDAVCYNHYFGWYGGDVSMNGEWFDRFHSENPEIPVGMSEYGCEALNWHTSEPVQGDYTEEYQAYYHEEMIKQLFSRPYIWGTYVWNMFDFGADARSEGGENGQNHKGLVTMDRKYKKDSFYAYKAHLSREPFVHICGKRYVDRVEELTQITVYTNQPTVELFADGVSLGKRESSDHFFYFQVPNKGETHLRAVAGACEDTSVIRKVAAFNESYRLKEKGAVLNWFDVTEVKGHFSIKDKIGDILKNEQAAEQLRKLLDKVSSIGGSFAGFKMTDDMMKMMEGFTVLRFTTLMSTAGVEVSKEQLLELNEQLCEIGKE